MDNRKNDKELDTTIWLKFDMVPGDREHVSALKCRVCIQFNEWLTSLRNYNPAFVNGSKNTTLKEYADTRKALINKLVKH